LHTVPHPPQFVALVVVLVSQPFAALPSQLPKPALHVGTQALAVQVVLPFGLLQGLAQTPQLLMLFVVLVSQPFEALPSQFPKPAEQAPRVQTPAGQLSAAFARSHSTLQSPQSVTVAMLRSQPLLALPSQFL
jgi:hypothetical protein